MTAAYVNVVGGKRVATEYSAATGLHTLKGVAGPADSKVGIPGVSGFVTELGAVYNPGDGLYYVVPG